MTVFYVSQQGGYLYHGDMREGDRLATPEELAIRELALIEAAKPKIVSMRQARLALLQTGKLADVGTIIAALPSPTKEAAQIEWEYATEVNRNQPLVQMLAPALGLSESQLDDLFLLASTL